MCGLFGGVTLGSFSFSENSYIYQLGVMAQLRGTDSTGIATVRKKRGRNKKISFDVFKDVGNSSNFLEQPEARRLLFTNNLFCVVGHTRRATHGDVNQTNAHPISVGKIIAVHNGVIDHFRPHKADEASRTDSLGLVERINQDGIESAISEVGDGAYALVYIDRSERTLNFARNWKRPLWMMWTAQKATLYWASERGMLELLREREGVGLFESPECLAPNILKTLELGTLTFTQKTLPIRASNSYYTPTTPFIQPLPALPPPQNRPILCGTCTREISECSCSWRKRVQQQSSTSVPSVTSLSQRRYRGWKRQDRPAEEVLELLKYGCCTCRIPQTLESPVYWVTPHKIICDSCTKDSSMYQYMVESYKQMFRGHLLQGEYPKHVAIH